MAWCIFLSKFSTACPTLFSNSMGELPECSLLVEGDLKSGEAIPVVLVRLLMTVILSPVSSVGYTGGHSTERVVVILVAVDAAGVRTF